MLHPFLDATLMLTASIDIKGMSEVAIPEPHKREQEYIDSLSYWVREQPELSRIVFVENSGWPLDRLRAAVSQANIHDKTIEYISMSENDYPREMGKGYGEFLMMDRATEISQQMRLSRRIVKLTGRAIVTNLSRLLRAVEVRDYDFLCDLRDHSLYRWLGIKASSQWCDARLYCFTLPFYDQNLRGKYLQLDYRKGEAAEDMLFAVAKKHLAGLGNPTMKVIPRFPIEPHFVGTTAHWGKSYASPRERTKRLLRGSLRRLTPWLYI